MFRTSFIPFITLAVLLTVLPASSAEAFWGFGSDGDRGKSGLDLVQGYDRNTVVTLEGRVAVTPDPAADPVTVEMIVGSERITVVLGPRWYLQHDDLNWKAGDTISVRGSKAQGKDGLTYLLAESVTGPEGSQMVLRNETGRPGWSGGFRGQQQGGAGQVQRGGPGSMQRGNAGSRGMR
jgi:hypothetical protein